MGSDGGITGGISDVIAGGLSRGAAGSVCDVMTGAWSMGVLGDSLT